MSFTLYNSSAGSGKTHTLVIEYLSIVLYNTSKFNRVLAVTFTNKAASEMKSRIIKYLGKISLGEMEDAVNDISKKMKKPLNEKIIKLNASIVLKKILHNYSDFAIMTIDSFIHKIVSTFSLELNLPLNFEVDINIRKIVSATTSMLIEKADESNYIGKVIKEFILLKMRQAESWNYEKDIEEVGYELFSEKSFKFFDDISKLTDEDFLTIITILKSKKAYFQDFIKGLAKEAVDLIENANLKVDDFKHKKKGFAARFYKMLNARKPDDFDPKIKFSEGKETDWVLDNSEYFSIIENLRDRKLESIRSRIVDFYNENIRMYLSVEAIIKDYPLTALTRKLKVIIDEYKRENGIVPISDFNLVVSNIIKKEIIPFIYWRIGDKFENYLLDEFQDTSSMQLNNLFPLIENSYSSGNKNIAVGDPKQSIYRWRASNPEIMGPEISKLVGKSFLKYKKLEFNYRSSKNIVEFNNRFFSDIFNEINKRDLAEANSYLKENIVQRSITGSDTDGYIEIYSTEEKLNKGKFTEFSVSYTIDSINSLIKEGFEYKDIVILTRKNSEAGIIAEELFKEGISVISADALFLNSSMEIRFIISVLRYIISKEKIYLIEMIRFLQYDNFNDLMIDNNIAAIKNIIINKAPGFFKMDFIQKTSLYETVEKLIRIFGLNKAKCGYVQGFLELAFSFSNKDQNDIFSFLKFWDEKKESEECSLIMPSGVNAVSIMTIHKAKGLEFPVVIIPFADWDIYPTSKGFRKNKFWVRENGEFFKDQIPYLIELKNSLEDTYFSEQYSKEKTHTLLDNLNLLYVAFTRSMTRLYVCINSGPNSISSRIKDRMDIMNIKANNNMFVFGKKSNYIKKRDIKTTSLETLNFIKSEPWINKISIKDSTSGIWDNNIKTVDENKSKKIKGTIIHQILSDIKTLDEVDPALNKAYYSGIISEKEKQILKKEIDHVLNISFEGSTLSSLFSNEWSIYCEKPILFNNSIFKPDRVQIKDQRAVIIEYKTGEQRMEDRRQVENYCSLIKKLGYESISAYIVYIKEKMISRVI